MEREKKWRKKAQRKKRVVLCRTLRKPAAADRAGEKTLPGDFLFCYGFEEDYQKAALILFHLFWSVPPLARCFPLEGFHFLSISLSLSLTVSHRFGYKHLFSITNAFFIRYDCCREILKTWTCEIRCHLKAPSDLELKNDMTRAVAVSEIQSCMSIMGHQ